MCTRVGTGPRMSECVCRLDDSLQNSHHVSHGTELRSSGLVTGGRGGGRLLPAEPPHQPFTVFFKRGIIHPVVRLPVDLKMSSQGFGIVQRERTGPGSLTLLWLNIGSTCLDSVYQTEEKNDRISHDTGWKCIMSPKRAAWVIWGSGA